MEFSGASTIQAVDLLADFRATAGTATIGLTVMTVVINSSAAVGTGTGTYRTGWKVGLYVDSSTAAVAELAAPTTDPYEDWMWNSLYYIGNNTLGWLGGQGEETWHTRVRSRRKVDEVQQTLWLVAEPQLAGATTLNYSAHARVLLALP